MRVVGPLAAWELLRLGRSGALPKARVALALTMLVGLGLAYNSAVVRGGGEESIAVASRVAANYLVAYLAVQTLAVVVLTPAIAAGAISDEKERGRLDFLRSSMLSPREIILGKYLGRVLYLLGVLATGLPVLAFSTLFGGVDPRLLAAGTLLSVTTVCALAAYSLSVAVRRANLRDAMVTVYANLALLTVAGTCCGWVPGLSALSPLWAMGFLVYLPADQILWWYHFAAILIVHPVATVTWLHHAVRDLASLSGDGPAPVTPPPTSPGEFEGAPWIRDHDDPFAWKERHFSPRYADGIGPASVGCATLVGTVGVVVLATFLFAVMFQAVSRDRGQLAGDLSTPARELTQFVLAPATFVVMLFVAVRTASSVTSERERDSLTPLLVLPVERSDILWAKWSAPLRWSRYALLAVVVVEGCVAFARGITPFAMLTVVAQVVAAVLLANTLGLWLSVTCRTTTRAVAWTLLTLLTLSVAPLVGGFAAFSPPAGVWLAHESPRAVLTPIAVQLVAAGALGWSAVRRFERYGK